jgi:catechol 2,3-dioxygenase
MLPDELRIRDVHLRVADLERSHAFYHGLIGLHARALPADAMAFAPPGSETPIIRVDAVAGTTMRPEHAFGLYHVAILYPDRASLAHVLKRLIAARWPFTGFSDHGVSEASYLSDPDGNGLELYVDRPRAAWPMQHGRLVMYSRALDVEDLLRAASDGAERSPVIGHVHLHVTELPAARRFYHDAIGFDITQDSYPGAVFMSAGGYHHHLAVNTWARAQAPSTSAGLLGWTLALGSRAALDALAERVHGEGHPVRAVEGGVVVTDPDGNTVSVVE